MGNTFDIVHVKYFIIFFVAQQPNSGLGHPIVEVSKSHSVRHTTLGRTPLDEGSTCRRDLYLTTHNTHKRQTSITPVGFATAIPASKWLQTCALDRAVTRISYFTI
jgi:hypothetical protein